jgi:hypothetical protein
MHQQAIFSRNKIKITCDNRRCKARLLQEVNHTLIKITNINDHKFYECKTKICHMETYVDAFNKKFCPTTNNYFLNFF